MNGASDHEKRERLRRRKGQSEEGLDGTQRLFERLLLPVASTTDAEATCAAVRQHVDPHVCELVAVHVIEKTAGYPDKLPHDAARERTDAIFNVVHACLANTDYRVSTELRYGQNVINEIFEAADAIDATANGFTPHLWRRWVKILTGDVGFKLVTTNSRPVIVFPSLDTDQRPHFESPIRDGDEGLFQDIVLPIASAKDAEATCHALLPHVPRGSRVIVVHVLRRYHRHSSPQNQASIEARKVRAQQILDWTSERLERAGFRTVTRLEYAVDVIGAIDEVADEEDADVIVVTPRKTTRWKKLLSGDVTYKLTHHTRWPVIVLPSKNEEPH